MNSEVVMIRLITVMWGPPREAVSFYTEMTEESVSNVGEHSN